jgi:hypothetical protein
MRSAGGNVGNTACDETVSPDAVNCSEAPVTSVFVASNYDASDATTWVIEPTGAADIDGTVGRTSAPPA